MAAIRCRLDATAASDPRKLPLDNRQSIGLNGSSPYLLGKLIEWKPDN